MAHIKADMTVDSKGFVSGVENAEDALDTLIDSMDDAEKESLRSADKMEKGLKDVTEAAKDTDRAARNVGKGFKQSASDATEGLDTIKDESQSTAKEAAASFDGSAESIIDAFQEVAANAFVGFGPAGVIAGLAAASGIGIAAAALVANEEQAKAAQDRMREFGLSIIDSGATAASLDQVIENLKLIVSNADDAPKKFKDIQKAAKDTGIDAAQLTAAYAGNEEALKASAKAAKEAYAEEVRFNSANDEGSVALTGKAEALGKVATELQKMAEDQAAAAQIEEDWLASGGNELVAKAEMISSVNDAYDELATNTQDFINAETGLFDTGSYITAMQEREKALRDYQTSITTSGLSPEAQEFLNSQGVEAASKMLEGYKSAGPDAKKELDRIWKEASKEASGSVETNLDGVVKKDRTAKITADVNTNRAQEDLDNLIKARTAVIKVDFQDRNGKRVY